MATWIDEQIHNYMKKWYLREQEPLEPFLNNRFKQFFQVDWRTPSQTEPSQEIGNLLQHANFMAQWKTPIGLCINKDLFQKADLDFGYWFSWKFSTLVHNLLQKHLKLWLLSPLKIFSLDFKIMVIVSSFRKHNLSQSQVYNEGKKPPFREIVGRIKWGNACKRTLKNYKLWDTYIV